MAGIAGSQGILGDAARGRREELLELLRQAYWMEIETVINYLAASINPDGVRARQIADALGRDVQEELAHAMLFARRIKDLRGIVPGSAELAPEQSYLQPPQRQTDVVHVIKGVLQAEGGAIEHYNRIIQAADGVDPVTADMVTQILHEEEGHLRLFQGYLREYEVQGF